MSKLAVLSLRNRALIALITIVAAVFGALAMVNLKQELIPSVEFPQLSIVTTYPGASPSVVASDVSTPIETAIQGIPGLESTTATSTTNASVVAASFTFGTNLATAEQKIDQAINRIKNTLPENVAPNVVALSIADFPAIQLAVTGYSDEQATQARLSTNVLGDIEQLPGVNSAQIVGGVGQRITITPDAAKLAAAGFSQQAVTDAVGQNGTLFPGGAITEGDRTLTVQTGSKLTSVGDVAALPLVPTTAAQLAAGVPTIGDVATVALAQDPVTSISRVDGKPALTIAVTKLPAANAVDVSAAVTGAIPSLQDSIGGGATLTVIFDQAPFIRQSIDSLTQEGLLGLAFAVLVILVFLLSVRSTLVTAISIPTSVLATFLGIQAFGYSLNILTLGALTIAIGRVVDDSIVVIENIKRHYVGDADKRTAITLAVREVASAVTASTLTTVAVFLPIAFVGGLTGELFRPFAVTVTIAMTASLLVALTIVPVLAYWFLRPGKPVLDVAGRAVDPEDPAAPPSRLQRGYLPILRWTLRHSAVTVVGAVVVLAGTVALTPLMKTNFLGDSGQNTFTMTQDIGPSASLEAKDAAAQRVEKAIIGIDGIVTVQSSIGSSGSALRDAFGSSAGVTYSITTDPNADQTALRDDVRTAVAGLPDAGTLTIATTGGGFGSSDVEVDVSAPDDASLRTATDAVVARLTGKDGISEVSTNLSESLPYIAVDVDRDAAAARGLSDATVGAIVDATMRPRSIGAVEVNGAATTIYLAAADSPASVEELRALAVPTATGVVRLDQVASVEQTNGPTSITTERGIRTATVTVTPAGDNLAATSATVTQELAAVSLPTGTDATIGGVVTQQGDAFGQLLLAMLAAVLIVYIIMVATFRSLLQPLLLLVSVPFAATGAILLQIVTGVPLGVASLIGLVMLIGIVVTNAIVLIDLVNQYREKGLATLESTVAGGSRRLRPILMTALATIFALIPMALGITGHGGFISQPLAIVVIGGLVSSTVLTLLVLPTLFNAVIGLRERMRARRGDAEPAVTAAPEPASLSRRERREAAVVVSAPQGLVGAADLRHDAVPTGRDRSADASPQSSGDDEASDVSAEPEASAAPAGRAASADATGGDVGLESAAEGRSDDAEPGDDGPESESEPPKA